MQAAGDDARSYGKAAIRYVALGAYCDAGVAQKSQSDRRWWLDAGWQCESMGAQAFHILIHSTAAERPSSCTRRSPAGLGTRSRLAADLILSLRSFIVLSSNTPQPARLGSIMFSSRLAAEMTSRALLELQHRAP